MAYLPFQFWFCESKVNNMAYMTNREFAEHEYKRKKQNAYADALVKEVRRLREENEMLRKQLEERSTDNER